MAKPKIGILGSGDVGRVLGGGFVSLGHEVKIGTRSPSQPKLQEWLQKNKPRATVGSAKDAAAFGSIIVLAVHGDAAEAAIRAAGAEHFKGKVVIEAMNPLKQGPTGMGLFVGGTDSLGERVQRWLPDAKVVKAFNMIGSHYMFQPQLPGGPPDLLVAGNDATAKTTVMGIVKDFGLNPIDLGGIESARYLEGVAMAWIMHGIVGGSWNHAFKLLKG